MRLLLAIILVCAFRIAAGEVETPLTSAQELEWLNKHVMPLFGARELKSTSVPALFDLKEDEWDFRERAYEWLVANQEADGHWDSMKHGAEVEADIAQSSIALLALLVRDNSEKRGRYVEEVTRGITWFVGKMDKDGAFAKERNLAYRIPAQAFAVFMLAEATMGGKQRTKDAAQKAITFLVNDITQNIKEMNLVHCALAVTAVLEAKVQGVKVPVDCWGALISRIEALSKSKVTSFMFDADVPTSSRANVTGGVSLLLLGWKTKEEKLRWRRLVENYGTPDATANDCLFNWFACILNLTAGKVDGRGPFFNAMTKPFKEHQQVTGPNKGSVDPHGLWAGAGRLFSTAFGAMLEASRPSRWSWSLEED